MKEKINIGKLLVILVLAAFVITSGIVLTFADEEPEQGQILAETIQARIHQPDTDIEETEIAIMPNPKYFQTFTGSGFVIDDTQQKAQPIRITVSKNMAFPIALLDKGGEEIFSQIEGKLAIAESSISDEETTTGIRTKVIKDEDVWSGTLTIGSGNLQEKYFVIGKENNREIDLTVISFGEYPIVMSELTVKRQIFPVIEIWNGNLDLDSSIYDGEWQLTAYSQRYYGYRYPVPLEIAQGEQAEISDYKIEPVTITKVKMFGFLPIGKEQAVVKIWKGGNLIAEKTLKEGETAEIGNLTINVVKIDGRLKVIAETSEIIS